jgi:hypothetical protein
MSAPAWKRLGLKLKYANEEAQIEKDLNSTDGASVVIKANGVVHSPIGTSDTVQPPRKRQRTESASSSDHAVQRNTVDLPDDEKVSNQPALPKRLKKSVSFSSDTKALPGLREDPPVSMKSKKDRPKTKTKRRVEQSTQRKPNAALEYLVQYQADRASWKFNKNRETWLLKHIFSTTDIPREHDLALATYFHGLKGTGARERLKKECFEALQKQQAGGTSTSPNDAALRAQFFARLAYEPGQDVEDATNGDNDSGKNEMQSWIQNQPRPRLILWSLAGLDAPEISREEARKRKKSRTTVVADDTSSSGSSDTESESNDSEPEIKEATSSSGSSSEDTSSSSESNDDESEDE